MTGSRVALAVSVAATATLLLLPPEAPNDLTLPVLLLALASLAGLVVVERAHAATSTRLLLAVSVALTVLAVVRPPHGSHDVWSYAMYGRILGVHHVNPYVRAPNAFAQDPYFHHLAHAWRGTRSVYGPLFTLLSAIIAVVAGGSALVARMLFQAMAAGAFLGIALVLVRGRTSSAMLAAVLFNPLLVVTVVNGGHNDALVALGILGAALAADHDRPVLAGALVALAAMVKVVALLAAVALALWWWRRRRPRASLATLAVAILPTAAGSLAFGVVAPWKPLMVASRHVNGPTLWRLVVAATASSGHTLPHRLGALAGLVVLGLSIGTCLLVVRHGASPAAAIAAALAAYVLATPYVMPWYLAWVFPVAAVAGQPSLAALLGVDAAVLLVAAQYHAVLRPDGLDRSLSGFRVVAQLFALVASVALVAGTARRPRLRTIPDSAGTLGESPTAWRGSLT